MMNLRTLAFIFLLFIGAPFFLSCGESAADAIGAPCKQNGDCPAGGRCLTGGKYPGGTCSFACDSSRDCPQYTACIDRDGGVCLPMCHHINDCRPSYQCDDQKNRGQSGITYVCIND
ncbi:MAG: hypothetical protein H0U74_04415 [Bradymonadaceae bacterium]|nr:hypothetical protein [Lujinxingiaceae bacterium]